ncbi:rod shape-determining protein RodA [Sphingomonas morindae]|uniref:Peptidoglycan glycosyltransferase MrdB n=1 Tax=Sphingomonas morindae TaxID=1541170 RepID=A0ABY4X6Q0_9SPHN|nr:rod shape-determining protein RodA [Sphingomonas morindae]USI72598.1 rod shape-determining protein RodA [Sphingomonas morindae]
MIGNSLIPAPLAALPWRVILTVTAITGFGLVVLYSAAGGSLRPWALGQGLRFVVLLALAIALSRLDQARLKAIALPAYGVLLVALLLTELVGAVRGGGQRWLDLGIIRLQPSELMKPVIVLVLARFYDRLPAGEIRGFHAIWPALALIGLPFALILVQPDLGTATMVMMGGVTVMFLAGLPLRLFIGAVLAALPLGAGAWSMLHEYQRNRVLIFLDPDMDPLGRGYHITQSKIAIGSGGLLGKGFLNGTQSHLDYLPEGQTDFVFATMAEEWGLAGGVLLIIGFLSVIWWGLGVALRAPTRFARLTAAGLSTTIFFYVAINLMMVMGLAPVVGIPLPLVSYGSSAVMTVMIIIGILFALDRDQRGYRPPFG